MCGIGAAFRLTYHLAAGSLVLAQECVYEEYMNPGVDYISINNNLSNLVEQGQWVYTHPKEAEEISIRGHAFYNAFLSPMQTFKFVSTYLSGPC